MTNRQKTSALADMSMPRMQRGPKPHTTTAIDDAASARPRSSGDGPMVMSAALVGGAEIDP